MTLTFELRFNGKKEPDTQDLVRNLLAKGKAQAKRLTLGQARISEYTERRTERRPVWRRVMCRGEDRPGKEAGSHPSPTERTNLHSSSSDPKSHVQRKSIKIST